MKRVTLSLRTHCLGVLKVISNSVHLSAEGVQGIELFGRSLFHLCSLSTADLECVPLQEIAASFCVSHTEMWMAWKGLTGEKSLYPSFEQGFRFPAVVPGVLQDVQGSLFPIFGLQFSALFKLLLTHKDVVGFGAGTPFPSALHMWFAATSSSGFQASQLAKQGEP